MNGEGFTASAAACLALLATSNVGAEIQIGIAAPLTGSMALGGEQTRAGAIMALEDLNGQPPTLEVDPESSRLQCLTWPEDDVMSWPGGVCG